MIFETIVVIGLLTLIGIVSWQCYLWKNKADTATQSLTNLKVKIKKRNRAVELDLATTSQIFSELSKRGKVILLIPHQQNDSTFVETLAAQLSPVQTMDVLRVAYTGIAGHLGAEAPPDEEDDE